MGEAVRVALLGFVVSLVLFAPVGARAAGPCDGRWNTRAQIAGGVRCMWHRFHPGHGGPAHAIAVASCESGLDPAATYAGNAGIWQFRTVYYPGRFRSIVLAHPLRRSWGLSDSPHDPRASSVVAAITVRRGGWGIWSCR